MMIVLEQATVELFLLAWPLTLHNSHGQPLFLLLFILGELLSPSLCFTPLTLCFCLLVFHLNTSLLFLFTLSRFFCVYVEREESLVGFFLFFFPWVVSNLLLPLLYSFSTGLLGQFFFLFIFLCGKLPCFHFFSWRI